MPAAPLKVRYIGSLHGGRRHNADDRPMSLTHWARRQDVGLSRDAVLRAIDLIFTRTGKDMSKLQKTCEEVVAFSPVRGGPRKA